MNRVDDGGYSKESGMVVLDESEGKFFLGGRLSFSKFVGNETTINVK